MLSEVIHSEHSYPAVLLAEQLAHQRFVHSGPLVLETNLLKNQRLQQIGDQPVSRRSEPSSCSTLNGEQPYPWDLLQPRDVISRHRIFSQLFPTVWTISSSFSPHRRIRSWRVNPKVYFGLISIWVIEKVSTGSSARFAR